jgi:hypothetical protein
MSEPATIDPPVTPPAAHPGAITIDLANLGNKAAPVTKVEVTPTPAPEKVEPDATAAAAAEVTKVIADIPKKPSDKEENMANLRKAREAAEAERDRVAKEFEEFKKKAPELPEEVKTRLTKAEQLEKEREDLQRTIRQLDLSKDPEFQAKYNQPITERIGIMGQTALAAGVSEADWKNAVANWNEDQFAEWQEAMSPIQKVKFNAAWTAAVDLYQQQQSELKNADMTYAEMQKKRQTEAEAQQKQYFTQNEQLARSVMAETIKPETLKEYEDLGPAVEGIMLQAARHEIPAKDIFQQLAANQVLARVTVKQADEIKDLRAQIAERDKKISEQDEFISNQSGAVPRGDAAGASGPTGDKTPLWKNIVVKAPGQ